MLFETQVVSIFFYLWLWHNFIRVDPLYFKDDHIAPFPGRIFMSIFSAKIAYLKSYGACYGQAGWESQGWFAIELVSQWEVQMPCGWLLNQDQMASSIWWVLVILQISNAQKSDEKWGYFCHSEVLALVASCLDFHHRGPFLKHEF